MFTDNRYVVANNIMARDTVCIFQSLNTTYNWFRMALICIRKRLIFFGVINNETVNGGTGV